MGKPGSKMFFSVAIFMILFQSSSSTAVGVSGDEDLETLVENVADHLSYSSSNYGYPQFEFMFLLLFLFFFSFFTFWFDFFFFDMGIGFMRWVTLEMSHGQWCRKKGTNLWLMISLFM